MVDFLLRFIDQVWLISAEMAVYIVLGLFFAALIHVFVRKEKIIRHFGGDGIGSVVKAALIGIPLPVCSCAVLPLSAQLHRAGASKGAILSFLIATPVTGVDSIFATFGVLGGVFTAFRVAASIILAVAAGAIASALSTEKPHNAETVDDTAEEANESFLRRVSNAAGYCINTLMPDIAAPLAIGIVLGALIGMAIPQEISLWASQHKAFGYFVVLAIAIPVYVCATASIPIAMGLLTAGFSPGAAFVFLVVGPSTNTSTMAIVYKLLGAKYLAVYLGVMIIGGLALGATLDMISPQAVATALTAHAHTEKLGDMEQLFAFLMWAMMLHSWIWPKVKKMFKKEEKRECGCDSCHT